MKATQTFRLSKRSKTLTALLGFADEDTRHAFRKGMIQAQLQSEIKVKAEKKNNRTGEQVA